MISKNIRACWTEGNLRRNYGDPTVNFEGDPIDYPAFHDYIRREFQKKGLVDLLRPEAQRPQAVPPYPVPEVMLVGKIEVLVQPPLVDVQQRLLAAELNMARDKIKEKYHLGITLIEKRLGSQPQEIVSIVRDLDNQIDKFHRIMRMLDNEYRAKPQKKTMLEILWRADSFPTATNAEEASMLMTAITLADMDL
jgi:hypothetical protein